VRRENVWSKEVHNTDHFHLPFIDLFLEDEIRIVLMSYEEEKMPPPTPDPLFKAKK